MQGTLGLSSRWAVVSGTLDRDDSPNLMEEKD